METTGHPVEMVSWNDAVEFCSKLSKQEKFKPSYFRAGETIAPLDGTGYRLPSEAEWEFACRAGTLTKYWFGDNGTDLVRVGWFGGTSGGRTHAAGELNVNPFGLADIHGNIWEWVQDGWDATFYGEFQEKAAINPHSPMSADSRHVVRGGYWNNAPSHCRSSGRHAYGSANRNVNFGFRVSLPVDAVRQALKVTGPAMPKAVATTPSAPAGDVEKLPAKFTNRLGMEFVLVGKGTAWLGGGNGQQGEKKVEMPDDFYLGRYEVTQAEWEQVTGQTPSWFSRTGGGKDAVKDIPDADLKQFPVENVSWDDAQLFLERLNKQDPSAGWVYRLPKADEREYACRGGPLSDKLDSAYDFYFDKPTNQLLPDQANFEHENGLKRTCGVGQYHPNRLGLYDLHGNVWEWCEDGPIDAPDNLKGKRPRYILSGGFLNGGVGACCARARVSAIPSEGGPKSPHGLRVARVPVGPAKPKPVATTPSAPALDPIDFAAERKAAEWLATLEVQALQVILRREDGSAVELSSAQRTVPEGRFTVEVIHVWDPESTRTAIDEVGMSLLGECRQLKDVGFGLRGLTSEGLARLRPSRTLKGLIFEGCGVDDRLWPLLARWPSLEALSLPKCVKLSDDGLTGLPPLPSLRHLWLHDTLVTDKGMQILAERGPDIVGLDIYQSPGPAYRSLEACRHFRNLNGLDCSPNQVTTAGVTVLAGLPQLHRLALYGPAHDETLEVLLPLREQLTHFGMNSLGPLSDTPPTSAAYRTLAQFTKLESVSLYGGQGSPTDADLFLLAQLPKLRRLDANFDEKSLSADHPNARRLYTPAGIDAFRKARPDVELHIDGKEYPAAK